MSAISIAVVGGGLLGRLLAWKLLQRGHRLCIFERGSRAAEQSAARIAASMLAPYTEVASAERQVFDWGLRALAWWPQHIAELGEATGVDITCRVDGSVVVAHELDQSTLAHFLQQLQAVVPDHLADVEQLSAARLAELEPARSVSVLERDLRGALIACFEDRLETPFARQELSIGELTQAQQRSGSPDKRS